MDNLTLESIAEALQRIDDFYEGGTIPYDIHQRLLNLENRVWMLVDSIQNGEGND